MFLNDALKVSPECVAFELVYSSILVLSLPIDALDIQLVYPPLKIQLDLTAPLILFFLEKSIEITRKYDFICRVDQNLTIKRTDQEPFCHCALDLLWWVDLTQRGNGEFVSGDRQLFDGTTAH